MARRTWALLVGALAVALAPGCSLPRGTLTSGAPFDGGPVDTGGGGRDTGPPIDTGVPIDGGPDGGAGCATSCDDANACTDDACVGSTCTHTPNSASCDDGVLCNGADTCAASTCSVHDGVDPCPGMSHCDAASDMCMGCGGDADCPADIPDAWGTCDFGGDLCATTGGMQMRSVQTFTCNHGTCDPGTRTESQACTRASTDGTMCAAPAYGAWGPCEYGTDPCTQTGMQTRTTTISQCNGGACVPADSAEAQACMRTTDGDPCGMPVISDWSACMVGAACSNTGMQTRTTMTPTCGGGACVVTTTSENQTCNLSGTPGACGATTCGAWSACAQTMPGTCDRTGSQTRSCSTPTCEPSGSGPACTGSTTTTEMQACSASVGGLACSTTSCTTCREPGRTDCRSGHTGSQRCSTTNGTCMDWGLGPFCGGLPVSTMQSCPCP